jgi:L-seryl-tRNA(Ser) seleniumtransferase
VAYLREDYDSIPALRMMRVSSEELHERAEHLMRKLHITCPPLHVEVIESRSVLGGGVAPGSTLRTHVLAISSSVTSANAICEKLRQWVTPIIARVEDGRVLIDLRTVTTEEEEIVAAALEGFPDGGEKANCQR